MAAAALIGTAATWLGILLAYDSYYWPPGGRGWPVSFFVVALVVARVPAQLRPAARPQAASPRPGARRPGRNEEAPACSPA